MTVKLLVKLAFSRWKTQGGAATSQLMTDNTDNTDNTDACLLQETDEDISVFIIGERVTFSRSRQLSTWANVYPVLISTELDYLLITKWRAGWVSISGKTRIFEHCPVGESKKSIHRLDSLFETPVCLQCRASTRPSWVDILSRKWKPAFDKRSAGQMHEIFSSSSSSSGVYNALYALSRNTVKSTRWVITVQSE